MPIVYEITCDKCGGHVIEHTDPPKVVTEKISMKDYITMKNKPQYDHAVYYYTHYSLICTNCGHIERYHV